MCVNEGRDNGKGGGKEAERETAEREEGNIFVPGTSEARIHGLILSNTVGLKRIAEVEHCPFIFGHIQRSPFNCFPFVSPSKSQPLH